MAAALIFAAIALLAAARLTRVITDDKIGEPLRRGVIRVAGRDSMLTYLAHCRWCTGLWVSIPAAFAAWWPGGLDDVVAAPDWLGIPALALAYSHLIGIGVRAETE